MLKNTIIIFPVLFVLILGACNTTGDNRESPDDPVLDEPVPERESLEEDSPAAAVPPEILFTLEAVDLYSGEALGLVLELAEDMGSIEYRIALGDQNFTGDAELVTEDDFSLQTIQMIRLFGFPWVESPGGLPDPVIEIQNTGDGFVFQNYGNAMNSFQIISLDQKYIVFHPRQEE